VQEFLPVSIKIYAWIRINLGWLGVFFLILAEVIIVLLVVGVIQQDENQEEKFNKASAPYVIPIVAGALISSVVTIQLANNMLRSLKTLPNQNYFQPGSNPSHSNRDKHLMA
jgi:hypothetical protein